MKKLFRPFFYGCIALSTFSVSASAQDVAVANNPLKSNPAYLNTIIDNHPTATAMPLANVNAKITRNFNREHKDAQNVKWYNNGNGYLADFDWNGVKSYSYYGKHGYWYADVRFGSAKDLSKADRQLIKSNYVDYNIGKAVEVNLGGDKHAWVVNLEDANNLVQARIMDDGLDEMAHYTTHTPAKTKKARIVIPQ